MSEPTKKPLSAEKLAQLQIARQKANEVRKANAELKQKEKMIKTIEHEERKQQVESKIKQLSAPKPEPAPVLRSKPKKERRVVYVEESSSDDEPEVVYVKKKKTPKPIVEEPEPEIEKMLTPAQPLEQQMSQAQIRAEMARMRREMAKKMMFQAF
jgi:hypothetical protein